MTSAWQEARRLRATYRYTRMRRVYLRDNQLCAECTRQHRTSLATEIDHIVPAHRAIHLFWDVTNWQALCKPCHKAKSEREGVNGASPQVRAWRKLARQPIPVAHGNDA